MLAFKIEGCERVAEEEVDVDLDEVPSQVELETFGEDVEDGEQEHGEGVH